MTHTAVPALSRGTRARWLARRRKGLTATDVPAVLGLSPWRTPLDVWLDKTQGTDVPASYAMNRGNALEPLIADEYARRHPDTFVEKPPLLLKHPEHQWLLCSLDRVAHAPDMTRVLEIKATSNWRDWEDGALPDMYAVQVLTQLLITGLPEAHVAADVNGRYEERAIPRDETWEAWALPILKKWWWLHVVAREPPDPMPPTDTPTKLNRVWLPDPELTRDATPPEVDLILELRDLAKERKDITVQVDTRRTQLRQNMRNHTRLLIDGRPAASIDTRGTLTIPNGATP